MDLRQAIRTVALGDALLAPEGSRALIEAFITRSPKEPDARRLKVLTLREREVLTLVGRGLSNIEIRRQLFLSPATVKTHVNRSMAKLGVRDRAQLVVIGYESGLVRPGEASGPGETWPKRFP